MLTVCEAAPLDFAEVLAEGVADDVEEGEVVEFEPLGDVDVAAGTEEVKVTP